jgi:cytochrome c oxidase subunit 3
MPILIDSKNGLFAAQQTCALRLPVQRHTVQEETEKAAVPPGGVLCYVVAASTAEFRFKGSSVSTREFIAGREAEAIPQRVYPTGMWLALGGILMFFMALVSAWVVRKGLSTSALEAPLALPWRLLAANTGVLVASSVTLEMARRRLRAGNTQQFSMWWYTTTALGLGFLIGQFAAWRAMWAAGVYLASNPDAGFFYLFTAAHAVHLTGGIAALLWIALRPLRRMAFDAAARVAAMYWHFLAALWCGIFVLLAVTGRW